MAGIIPLPIERYFVPVEAATQARRKGPRHDPTDNRARGDTQTCSAWLPPNQSAFTAAEAAAFRNRRSLARLACLVLQNHKSLARQS